MEHHDEEFEATPDEPSAAKLSLVGGFLGTVSGLKRGGPGGAVLGGLVGGTAGYLTGAALDESSPSQYTDPSDGPLEISVGDEADDDAESAAETDETEDGDGPE